MPYHAKTIAYVFVKKGIEEGLPVTQMKLQKMVYFAHGIHLALYNEPLIREHFQAWKYGPVVRDIYSYFKFYGSQPISDLSWLTLVGFKEEDLESLDERAHRSIDLTWDTLKGLNAGQLSNWTHKVGSPWADVYVDGVSDIYIPNESIGEYFKQFRVENG